MDPRLLSKTYLYHFQDRRSTRWRRGEFSRGSLCLSMQPSSHKGRGWWWPQRNLLFAHMWTVVLWSSLTQNPWKWRSQVGLSCWYISANIAIFLWITYRVLWRFTQGFYALDMRLILQVPFPYKIASFQKMFSQKQKWCSVEFRNWKSVFSAKGMSQSKTLEMQQRTTVT